MSKSEYTPTTEDVRNEYTGFNETGGGPEFDRWLRKVQAEAWAEGAKDQWLYGPKGIPNENKKNPYQEDAR